MAHKYRYTILLDRYPDSDWGPEQGNEPDFHDGSDEAAMRQVAAELQEAMNEYGLPVGFFQIVSRERVEEE